SNRNYLAVLRHHHSACLHDFAAFLPNGVISKVIDSLPSDGVEVRIPLDRILLTIIAGLIHRVGRLSFCVGSFISYSYAFGGWRSHGSSALRRRTRVVFRLGDIELPRADFSGQRFFAALLLPEDPVVDGSTLCVFAS